MLPRTLITAKDSLTILRMALCRHAECTGTTHLLVRLRWPLTGDEGRVTPTPRPRPPRARPTAPGCGRRSRAGCHRSEVVFLGSCPGTRCAMTRFGYTLVTEQSGPKELVRYAVSAERAGFDFEVSSDHYFPWLASTKASSRSDCSRLHSNAARRLSISRSACSMRVS